MPLSRASQQRISRQPAMPLAKIQISRRLSQRQKKGGDVRDDLESDADDDD